MKKHLESSSDTIFLWSPFFFLTLFLKLTMTSSSDFPLSYRQCPLCSLIFFSHFLWIAESSPCRHTHGLFRWGSRSRRGICEVEKRDKRILIRLQVWNALNKRDWREGTGSGLTGLVQGKRTWPQPPFKMLLSEAFSSVTYGKLKLNFLTPRRRRGDQSTDSFRINSTWWLPASDGRKVRKWKIVQASWTAI